MFSASLRYLLPQVSLSTPLLESTCYALPMSSSTTVSAIQPTSPWQPPATHAGRSSSWLSHGNKHSPLPSPLLCAPQASMKSCFKNGRAAGIAEEQKNIVHHGLYKFDDVLSKREDCINKVDLSSPSLLTASPACEDLIPRRK